MTLAKVITKLIMEDDKIIIVTPKMLKALVMVRDLSGDN